MKKIIVLALVVLSCMVNARTAYWAYEYPASIGLDSVEVDLYYNASTDVTDSIRDSIETFPISGLITINDKKSWRIRYKEYYHGNSTPITWAEQVWGDAGTPTATAPVGAGLCTVHGYVSDNQGNVIIGALLTFAMSEEKLKDTCNNATVIPYGHQVATDDTGYFSIELLQSSCVGNTAYKVTIRVENEYGVIERKEETLMIPADSTTYLLKY